MEFNFTISNAKESDIPEWMQLVGLVEDNFPGLNQEEYKINLAENIRNGTALCAKVESQIVGILLFSLEQSVLEFLAVHPDCRGKGTASALVQEMVNSFSTYYEIWVTTYREGDTKGEAARRLYKKLGFAEDALVEEFGYPCQKFVLRDKQSRTI